VIDRLIPFEPWPMDAPPPPMGAMTVELSDVEVREALCAYIGNKRIENFPAYAVVQYQTEPGKVRVRVTYWKTGENP
jgi:hypothetical protein